MQSKNYVKLSVLSLILITALAGCGCGCKKKEEIKVEEQPAEPVVATIPYDKPENASPITGLACDNYQKRSFGVMYSGSNDARPYWKNLDKADFVLEMPHRMHNEPRLMGIFQCDVPNEIGPMRSGRIDHMSVADSLGAVFVTWGKSIVAKSAMDKEFADNLEVGNGTKSSDGTRAGYIDSSIKFYSANSAYADLNGIIGMSKDKGYSGDNIFEGFKHQGEIAMEERPDYGMVDVKFDTSSYRIKYQYDKETNSYKRFHKGEPSKDMISGEQYAPKNIIGIIAKRDSWLAEKDYVAEGLLDPWDGVPQEKVESNQYPNMQLGDPWFDTKFEGDAKFYMNGQEYKGTWKREKGQNKPFKFYYEDGSEVHFVSGQIWMHVLPHGQKVGYEDAEEYAERLEDEAAEGTEVQ
ncbi:MAG: DUF3048 C-terminal domain-containing protein [Candidatus Moranbacteria bacterium]|nr:DUF3048 C-terminal domain-containing protein [Candidatus Moranbacteria bacterium]